MTDKKFRQISLRSRKSSENKLALSPKWELAETQITYPGQ